MATKLSNGWTVSSGTQGVGQAMTQAAAKSIMDKVATEDMNANELLEEIGKAMGVNASWSVDIFDNIKATDMANAFKQGILPSTQDAIEAIKNKEYIGDKNDYMNEVLSDIFGLEYDKPTGFVSKGAVSEESKVSDAFSNNLDSIIGDGSSATHFDVDGVDYIYDPSTGHIVRGDTGNVVVKNANGSVGDEYTGVINGVTYEDYINSLGNNGGSANGSASGSMSGSATGSVSGSTGGTTSTPSTGGSVTGGTTTGSSTGVVNTKTGADALADYLSALKIDSDFSKNLNTSRENIESKYNTLFENLRTGDYTQKPYYQTILESYGIKGDAAANNASASGAAANAGNLDSYAAANAQRQQLAFKNAAESAALNAYNSEVASLLQTLSDLGVNVNDLYKTWASELDSQRSGAVNAYLGQLGAETDKYVSDNALAGDKYTADTNKYLGDVQASIDKYLGDLQASTDKYITDANVQMNAANNAANKELADLEVKYNTEMAELDRKQELLKQEMVNASSERIAQIEKEIREIEATKAETTEKYKVDKALEESKYVADKEADSYLEGLKYNTTTGGEIEVKDPTTEEYNKAVEIYRTQGSSALEKYIDSLARGKQDLVRNYVEKHAATISNDDLYAIAAYTNYAMKQGGRGYSDATKDAWIDYVSKNPEMNTDQNKDLVMEYLNKTFATN